MTEQLHPQDPFPDQGDQGRHLAGDAPGFSATPAGLRQELTDTSRDPRPQQSQYPGIADTLTPPYPATLTSEQAQHPDDQDRAAAQEPEPPATEGGVAKRPHRAALAAAVVVLCCVAFGGFLLLRANKTPVLEMSGVSIVVHGGTASGTAFASKGPCNDGGDLMNPDYQDLESASITVYDDAGKVVGIGTLGAGESAPDVHGAFWGTCVTAFHIGNLPDRPFYQVEIANRGRVIVNRSDISSVVLTLGSL